MEKLVTRIIKKELRRLWEKRISIITSITSVVSLALIIKKAINVANQLGTIVFFGL